MVFCCFSHEGLQKPKAECSRGFSEENSVILRESQKDSSREQQGAAVWLLLAYLGELVEFGILGEVSTARSRFTAFVSDLDAGTERTLNRFVGGAHWRSSRYTRALCCSGGSGAFQWSPVTRQKATGTD